VTGPHAEGGPMPPVDRGLLAQHEQRIAMAFPKHGSIRVLAVVEEAGTWSVDLDLADLADEVLVADVDPTAVRFVIHVADDAFQHDLPVAVLRQIAKKIGEL
jgi:hypothetical protein